MKTLVIIGHRELNGVTYHHGAEMPPGLLPDELRDWWIDHGWAREYGNAERRSLYRLFSQFSGCTEREQLAKDEIDQLALPA